MRFINKHSVLQINNACYLLNETNHYGYPEEEKTILTFIRKNAEDVFQTVGMNLLSKNLLNMVGLLVLLIKNLVRIVGMLFLLLYAMSFFQ